MQRRRLTGHHHNLIEAAALYSAEPEQQTPAPASSETGNSPQSEGWSSCSPQPQTELADPVPADKTIIMSTIKIITSIIIMIIIGMP